MSSYENPSIADALLIALVGFATVFVVLIVLMGIIVLISRIFGEKRLSPTPCPMLCLRLHPVSQLLPRRKKRIIIPA